MKIIGPHAHLSVSTASELLPEFGLKYPGGWDWLEKRLDDARAGRAGLWLPAVHDQVIGLAIDTPKGRHERKLSTFMIAPAFRSKGLGARLLAALKTSWLEADIDRVTVTVDETDAATLSFFERNRFVAVDSDVIPYGPERFDRRLAWAANAEFAGAVAVH